MGKRIGAVVAVLATLSLFAAYRFVQDAHQFVAEEAQRQETAEQAHKLAEEEARQIVATEQAAVEARQKEAERQATAAAAKAMREEQQQAAAAAAAASTWKSSAIDWQDTQLGTVTVVTSTVRSRYDWRAANEAHNHAPANMSSLVGDDQFQRC
jgi:hypothetical protein